MPAKPPAHEATDEVLAERAQRGCGRSFEELMRRYQSPLLHFLRTRAAAADAEDVLQETFLRALRGLATYQPPRSVRAWLFAIARHALADAGRRQRDAPAGAFADAVDPAVDAHQRLTDREQRGQLWALARRLLSEDQCTALWLHYVESMPTDEVASAMDRSRSSVKTMLCRARKLLTAHLAPEERLVAASTPDALKK